MATKIPAELKKIVSKFVQKWLNLFNLNIYIVIINFFYLFSSYM